MFIKKNLKRIDVVNLYQALSILQIGEVDQRDDNGQISKVVALPVKTAYKISRQKDKLKSIVETYDELQKATKEKFDKEAEGLKETDKKYKDKIEKWKEDATAAFKEISNETEKAVEILEKPIELDDLGDVQIKSVVFELAPEDFFKVE